MIENEIITNWIKNKRKDIEGLNNILKKVKKLDSSELKADLENKIVEWVLHHSKAIKEMEELTPKDTEENQ